MNEFLTQVVPVLQTAFWGVLLAGITYLGQAIVKSTPKLIDLLIAKVGITKYNRYKLIAAEVWNKIEEDGRLGNLAGDKLTEFVKLMKIKFPKISDEDIDLLNKAIAGEINKDKALIVDVINAPQEADESVETQNIEFGVIPTDEVK